MTQDAFLPLAQAHMDGIFRLAFGCLKSRADAEDVTQTVLLRLYQRRDPFEGEDHLKHWLVRVTLNECKKYWRSPWRHTEDFAAYADTLTFEEPRQGEVFEAVMALDAKYRAVIFLYYYEGYTLAEIAAALRLPRGTVGTRLSRARQQLRQSLSEEVFP
jgi:RNA polymerase sigma factor (sigma-70 family)